MYVNIKALVIREARYKEADKILTLLTPDRGRITASAHGALSKKSRIASACQQLTYSDFVLDLRNGRYSVKEASVMESFSGLRADFSAMALACYFCDCAETFAFEDEGNDEILRLCLNSFYALSNGLYPQSKIKASFEFRLISAAGYCPDLGDCPV